MSALPSIKPSFSGPADNSVANNIRNALQNMDEESKNAFDSSPLTDPTFYKAFQNTVFSKGASSIPGLGIPADSERLSTEDAKDNTYVALDSLGIDVDFLTKRSADGEPVRYMTVTGPNIEKFEALGQMIAAEHAQTQIPEPGKLETA